MIHNAQAPATVEPEVIRFYNAEVYGHKNLDLASQLLGLVGRIGHYLT